MPMFEGGSQATRQQGEQLNQPGGAARPLYDLVLRTLIGNVMSPQETDIPVPLQQSVSGLQDLLPTLFAQGFGPPTGLASRLSAGAASTPSSSSPMRTPGMGSPSAVPPIPSFGRTQTREELGLGKPEVVDPRYLPSEEDVLAEIPPMRTSTPYRKQQQRQDRLGRLKERQATATEAGRERKAEKLGRKIGRTEKRIERSYVG